MQWQPGKAFSPFDALASGVRTLAQADTRRLADRMIQWLNTQSTPSSPGVQSSSAGREGQPSYKSRAEPLSN